MTDEKRNAEADLRMCDALPGAQWHECQRSSAMADTSMRFEDGVCAYGNPDLDRREKDSWFVVLRANHHFKWADDVHAFCAAARTALPHWINRALEAEQDSNEWRSFADGLSHEHFAMESKLKAAEARVAELEAKLTLMRKAYHFGPSMVGAMLYAHRVKETDSNITVTPQDQIAQSLGVTQEQIDDWERGRLDGQGQDNSAHPWFEEVIKEAEE
jgi:DNA-binding transcriptional regulator YiaG